MHLQKKSLNLQDTMLQEEIPAVCVVLGQCTYEYVYMISMHES